MWEAEQHRSQLGDTDQPVGSAQDWDVWKKRVGRREESRQSPGKEGQGGYRAELGMLQGRLRGNRYGWGGRSRIRAAPKLN